MTDPTPLAAPVAHVSECEACFTPDVCQLRGTCDHYSAERLRVAKQDAAAATDPEPAQRPGDLLAWGSQAVLDVAAERRRQIGAYDWTPEHDDEHDGGELAAAACSYALAAADKLHPLSQGDGNFSPDNLPPAWPWEPASFKPGEPRRMLVKAGALILAEIERLDRAA